MKAIIALRLQVIAEGIETQSQLRLIRALGCEFAQGFYIARPLTPAAFEELVSHLPASWDEA